MENLITANLAEFCYREKEMARDLLNAMLNHGLPKDFEDSEVTIMLNKKSGYVFLTNSEYQVAMVSNGKLYSFYTTPYAGLEGSYEDLMLEYDSMNDEDKEYMDNLKQYNVK